MMATGAVLLREIDRSARDEAVAQGLLLARTFASSFSIPLARGKHELIQRQIDQIVELPGLFPQVARVVVVDQTGRVVAHTDPTRFNEPWVDPDPNTTQTFVEPDRGGEGGTPLLILKVPVEAAVRFGTVEITLSVAGPFEAAQRSSRHVLWGLVVTIVLLSATLTILLHRLVVRPLRKLASEVEQWDGAAIAPSLEGGPVEVLTVANAFDELAEHLNEHKLGLERMVAERTRALSEAYDQLRDANGQLEQLATTDPLTGLSNRRAFAERMKTEMARCQRSGEPLSLLLFDIDHFKRINDSLGHLEGDAALIWLSGVLSSGRRSTDLVARWGGEEFAVLLSNTTHETALVMAERFRQVTERNSSPCHFTISGGVATMPEHGLDERTLVSAADLALYSAKEHGRNRIHGARAGKLELEPVEKLA